MEQLEITYNEMTFTVWGYYTKECYTDSMQPDEPAEFDVREIYKGDNDNIIALLNENIVESLNEKALELILNR